MKVKDVTATEADIDAAIAFTNALVRDIHQRWPIWLEMAEANPMKMSSPYMAVAVQLMTQGMMAMLCASVAPPDVIKCAEGLLDLCCDPAFHEQLAAQRDDKKEIMAFFEKVVMENAAHLAKQNKVN